MLEDERAYAYIRQAYDYMELMKPGTILHLQASEEKLPWLLVTAGAFFSAQDHWMEFDFNDDWTKLRRNQPLPPGFVKYLKGKQEVPEKPDKAAGTKIVSGFYYSIPQCRRLDSRFPLPFHFILTFFCDFVPIV